MKKNRKVWTSLCIMVSIVLVFVTCSKKETEDISSSGTSNASRLKTTVAGDSIVIKRDPAGLYKMIRIKLKTEVNALDTQTVASSSISTDTMSCDMVFYNQKSLGSCSVDSFTGQPALVLSRRLVEGTSTAYYAMGRRCANVGDTVYNNINENNYRYSIYGGSGTPLYDRKKILPFSRSSYSYLYCASHLDSLSKSTVKLFYDSCIIGNRFQIATAPTQPTYQNVYVLRLYRSNDSSHYYWYKLMVVRYQNGTDATNKKYMTIKYQFIKKTSR